MSWVGHRGSGDWRENQSHVAPPREECSEDNQLRALRNEGKSYMSSGVKASGRKRDGDRGEKEKASLSVTSYINKALWGRLEALGPPCQSQSFPTLLPRSQALSSV